MIYLSSKVDMGGVVFDKYSLISVTHLQLLAK